MHRINLLLMSFIVSYKVELTVRNPELKISKKMHELYKNKSLIFKSYITVESSRHTYTIQIVQFEITVMVED